MSNTTNTKQRDLLHTQENVENNPKENSPLIEREKLKGTPFTLIHRNDEWFIVMGDYKITNSTQTKEQQLSLFEEKKWEIIVVLIQITTHRILDIDFDLKPNKNIFNLESPYETESL